VGSAAGGGRRGVGSAQAVSSPSHGGDVAILERSGRLDALVANAGIGAGSSVEETEMEVVRDKPLEIYIYFS